MTTPENEVGFPARSWRALERREPPGFDRLRRFRSPLRGPWLTSVFAVVLLVGMPVVAITGLLSYVAYGPEFGQASPGNADLLHLPAFAWPTSPSWLYQLTQGLHVGLGLVLIPVVLAKLWSVIPKLFTWPPARSIAHVLERLSLLLLVGSTLFELATGVLNIQYDYLFGFAFTTAHYYGGWIFVGSFVVHTVLKFGSMRRGLRSRSLRAELRTPVVETEPEPPDDTGLVAAEPAPPTLSRRGALGLVAGGSALVAVLTAGQTLGGQARSLAFLLPRGRTVDDGPTGFPVNRTARAAGIPSTSSPAAKAPTPSPVKSGGAATSTGSSGPPRVS